MRIDDGFMERPLRGSRSMRNLLFPRATLFSHNNVRHKRSVRCKDFDERVRVALMLLKLGLGCGR
ncbi:hypothetical protein, partial [Paraburkholderia strydomiana]